MDVSGEQSIGPALGKNLEPPAPTRGLAWLEQGECGREERSDRRVQISEDFMGQDPYGSRGPVTALSSKLRRLHSRLSDVFFSFVFFHAGCKV